MLRIPTMNSDVIKGVRQLLIKESDFRKRFLTTIGKKINQPIPKSEWIKATALGGFKEVGRSSLLIETNHSKIIIDCGVSPEPSIKGLEAVTSDENKAFPYLDSANITINDLDAVILTHAHMDHMGFVPYLFKFGYEGPVYCTPADQGPCRPAALRLHKARAEGRRHADLRGEGRQEDAHAHDNQGLRRGHERHRTRSS